MGEEPEALCGSVAELLALLASGMLKVVLFTSRYTLDTFVKGLDDNIARRGGKQSSVCANLRPPQRENCKITKGIHNSGVDFTE